MVISDAQLPWFIGVGSAVLIVGVWFAILAAEDIRRRRDRRRKGRAIVDKARAAVDPNAEANADPVGIAVAADRAPANDDLPEVEEAVVNRLIVEIGRAQIRHRFPGIYGEDGQP